MTPLRSNRGFTLLEVMVALALAAVALVALLEGHARSLQQQLVVEEHIKATALARQMLLEARQIPFNALREDHGETEDKTLTWNRVLLPSLTADLRQVNIEVARPGEDAPLVTVITLVRK